MSKLKLEWKELHKGEWWRCYHEINGVGHVSVQLNFQPIVSVQWRATTRTQGPFFFDDKMKAKRYVEKLLSQ